MELEKSSGNIKIISVIGGSNTIIKHSYSRIIKLIGYSVKNYGIGATNSLMGLAQESEYNIIQGSDIIIFDYFINDSNHFFQGLNSLERIRGTLKALVNRVRKYNKKILFVLTHNYLTKSSLESNPVLDLYLDLIREYSIAYIDSWKILLDNSSMNKRMKRFYMLDNRFSENHLNDKAMEILAREITEKVRKNKVSVPQKTIRSKFDEYSFCSISNYIKENYEFKNSLVDIVCARIKPDQKIKLSIRGTLLAIKYISDSNSGYIRIKNTEKTIDKNTYKIFSTDNKPLVSLLTFNTMSFQNDKDGSYEISLIKKANINSFLYDKERWESDPIEGKNQVLKVIGFLINGKVMDINIRD